MEDERDGHGHDSEFVCVCLNCVCFHLGSLTHLISNYHIHMQHVPGSTFIHATLHMEVMSFYSMFFHFPLSIVDYGRLFESGCKHDDKWIRSLFGLMLLCAIVTEMLIGYGGIMDRDYIQV